MACHRRFMRNKNSRQRRRASALHVVEVIVYQKYTFSMYSGEVKRVTMRFRNNMMNSVIDKFGRQDFASPVDKDHFEITAFVAVSPQFYAWVFGLKNYVTIVSPAEVREE